MSTNASLLFLNYQLWNDFVNDETQCMQLSRDEEIKFLSAKDKDRKCSFGRHAISD